MFFPSEELRKRFYDLVIEMTADEEGICDLDSITDTGPINVFQIFKQIKKYLIFLLD
jgi:hypothetical protein